MVELRELDVAAKKQLSELEGEWRQELQDELQKLTSQIQSLGGQ